MYSFYSANQYVTIQR